jgi:hypothetical protein
LAWCDDRLGHGVNQRCEGLQVPTRTWQLSVKSVIVADWMVDCRGG